MLIITTTVITNQKKKTENRNTMKGNVGGYVVVFKHNNTMCVIVDRHRE